MPVAFVDKPAVGAPAEVHTTQQNPVGMIATGNDGYQYIYLKGVASTVAGDFVSFEETTFTTARLTSTSKGGVAIATAAVVANNWGWYGYVGTFTSNCLSATLSNAVIYATGTAGSAEDVLAVGAQIVGAVSRGAPVTSTGGGSQTVTINRPWVGVTGHSA